MSPYQSAGARWLSEDEGGDTAKKVNRFSDEEGPGRGRSKKDPVAGASSSARTSTEKVAQRDSETRQEPSTIGGDASTSAPTSVGRSRLPSAGLAAAKAHWKAMEGNGRGRMRRANSEEAVAQSSSRGGETAPATGQETTISGHPIATEEGVPMPSLREIAPMGRQSSGVATYQSPINPCVPPGAPSTSPLPPTHSVEPSSSSTPTIATTSSSITPATSMTSVPDFATGRGGDGISGHGTPTEAQQTPDRQDEELSRAESRTQLLPQLKAILTCPVCVSQQDSSRRGYPFLRQPITLRCGHTVCLSHVNIRKVPALDVSAFPETEAHARLAAWSASRLSAYATAACPIPVCRQHIHGDKTSTNTSTDTTVAGSTYDVTLDTRQHQLSERNDVLHYPPPLLPEAVLGSENANADGEAAIERGVPIDFTVSKVLAIILRELERERLASLPSYKIPNASALDVEADAEDDGNTSATGSDAVEDSSFEPTTFGQVPRPDASFLPLGDSSLRPRHSRHQGLHRTDSIMSKRRRRSTAVGQKDSHNLSPPHKRTGLPSGAPGPQPRQNSYSFEKELALTLECDVCTSLFHEPMTTPCGHTFCSRCLARSLDHSTRCPVCRQDLPSFSFYQDHPTNKLLTSVVITAFHEEAMERRRGIEEEERDARLDTPIFVCSLAFPGMPTILHVFEPRYRLMLRRAIESGRPRFGMVMPARGAGNPNLAGVMEYGTMLDIKSIQMLPDGRSMVETVGAYRFRLLEKGSLDGYSVGRIERLDDISPEDEAMLERLSLERARNARAEARQQRGHTIRQGQSEQANEAAPSSVSRPPMARSLSTSHQSTSASAVGLPEMQPGEAEPSTDELMTICRSFIDQLRSGSAPWLLQRLNNTYGPMPEDPSLFSFWMALVMPIDEYEKARLLPIRSPRLRLRLIAHWVEQLRSSWCHTLLISYFCNSQVLERLRDPQE
ncbi:hypothetical protein QFC21_004476 [Naganishia friedmannii]|uniref:Uncharacterized protein n=1 Tax=Naganishia friedmannii TaxID=89922 RepID=A0ACC2VHW1_9TREE|nr:hypothetical protein QFC21_004476 [Naganishia friedmannii]